MAIGVWPGFRWMKQITILAASGVTSSPRCRRSIPDLVALPTPVTLILDDYHLEEVRHLIRSIELGKQWGMAGASADGYAALVRTRQALGREEDALVLLHEVTQFVREKKATPWTARQSELHQVRLWLIQGNIGTEVNWVAAQTGDQYTAYDGHSRWTFVIHDAEQCTTLARVELARHRPDEAVRRLDLLLRIAKSGNWMAHVETSGI